MNRRLLSSLILSVAVLLWAGTLASASQRSEQLYSRGLVEFHAQRYPEALRLFDEAVQADEHDIVARYYRGVTRGRLGTYDLAVSDLRAVTAARPDIEQATLELGVALVETGAYRDAVPVLEQAQRVPALEARAALFLGLAQLHLRQTANARQQFQRAARDPELRLTASYYEGVAYYEEGNWDEAKGRFTAVATARPDTEIGRAANAFLQKLRGEAPAFQVYGTLGFEYDSNVVLAPSDEVVKDAAGISGQADGRAVITFGGAYVPWRHERTELSIGYEFYQSLHFDLTDFDLQDHRPSAQLTFDADYLRLGFLGRYDFYLLRADSFLQEATGLPWVEVPEGDFGRAEVFYRMRRRDYLKQPFIGLRDAFNHAAGARQYVYLGSPDRAVSIGYQFDREDPINAEGNQFAYDGHQVDAGLTWAFPAEITTELFYAYRHERYAAASDGRRDEEHQVVAVAQKQLSEHLDVALAYLGTINNSTDPRFDYDRDIVSVTLGVRF